MDLPPDTMFQIAEPDWNTHESADFKQTMSGMDMEYLAMANRTEIQETGFKNNAGVYETRKAILKMQPGVNFDSGYETGNNNFIYSKDWRDAGLQISKTLFDLLPTAQTSHNQAEAEYSKGMALKMAVTTQLHLARQQYIMAKEMYNLSAILINPVNKSSLTAKNTAGIKNETDDLISRIRFHEAYTELEMAADRLFNSFGITRLPANINSASVSYLTTALQNSLNKRARLLSQSSFDTEPKKNKTADKPVQTLADKPENIPEIKKPSPEPDDKPSESYKFQSKQAVVVNASAAEKKGQKPVREISVFRDVVNIHFEPSAKSAIKGQGLIGERYNLLGWSPKGWLKIEMSDGSYGWIPTKYAKPIENEDSENKFTQPEIPEKQVKINPAPAPKPADRMIVTTTRANVRTGPGLNFKVIYISEKGSRFKVQGSSGEWFEIRTKSGSKGWLHDSTVKVLAGN
ncbi:SH3 domain-containing protein [Desulfonema limicola]|uniref:SH3 domain-containing protein n=1 Tax=Desulfonema limicola TaxID=45656 RepID=A0A975BCU8_9BACT|nr:SH3 domain-containing protein [Desulfonema limicola]QTA83122.1 SH3 domain-containing protein [Desulfonema limicola]